MGWTHSWYRDSELDQTAFESAVRDTRIALDKCGVELAGFDGQGHAKFDLDHVVFNGKAPACCEPFEIARVEFDRRGRQTVFGYCKTQQMPYDLCVQIALVIFRHHLYPAFRVSSDGSIDQWSSALDAVKAALQYGGDFSLDE